MLIWGKILREEFVKPYLHDGSAGPANVTGKLLMMVPSEGSLLGGKRSKGEEGGQDSSLCRKWGKGGLSRERCSHSAMRGCLFFCSLLLSADSHNLYTRLSLVPHTYHTLGRATIANLSSFCRTFTRRGPKFLT